MLKSWGIKLLQDILIRFTRRFQIMVIGDLSEDSASQLSSEGKEESDK